MGAISTAVLATIGKLAAEVTPAVLDSRRKNRQARMDNVLTWRLFRYMREAEQLDLPGHERMFWVVGRIYKKHKKLTKNVAIHEVVAAAQMVFEAMKELEELGEDAFGLAPGPPKR